MPFSDCNLNIHIIWELGQYVQSSKNLISNSLFSFLFPKNLWNDKLLRLSELLCNLIDHAVLAVPIDRNSP